MAAVIKTAHQKTRGAYGAVRLHQEPLAAGHMVSLWKVKEIRWKHGLVLKRKHKFVRTADSNRSLPASQNILSRNFTQKACNLAWVSDLAYIPPVKDGCILPE